MSIQLKTYKHKFIQFGSSTQITQNQALEAPPASSRYGGGYFLGSVQVLENRQTSTNNQINAQKT